MGNYILVTAAESDSNGQPKNPGTINGGFYEKTEDPNSNHPSFVIAVDNLDTHMKKIQQGGGKIVGEPTDIPGIGKFVSFVDTEGNRLSILQALPR
jgi:predicted enzyme related to lactoylglutathione lyase